MPLLSQESFNDPMSSGTAQQTMSDVLTANSPLSQNQAGSATQGMREGLQNDLMNRGNPLANRMEEQRAGINDPFNQNLTGQVNQYKGNPAEIDKNLQDLNALGDLYTGNLPSGVNFSQHEYQGDHDTADWVHGVSQVVVGAAMLAGTKWGRNHAVVRATNSLLEEEKDNIGDIFKRTGSPSEAGFRENYAKMEHAWLKHIDERAASDKFTPITNRVNRLENKRLNALERAAGKAPDNPSVMSKSLKGKTLTQPAKTLTEASANAVKGGEKVVARYATKEGVRVATKEAERGIAKGIAVRVLPRIGLAAVVPAGTIISVALIALDPGIVNLFRKGLVEGLISDARTPDMDTPPEPPRTYFLPLCYDGNRDPAIEKTDTELVAVNNSTFGFNPDDVWPQNPNIETTGTFDSYQEVFNQMTDLVVEAVQASYGPLQEYQEEQQVNRLLEARAPFIEAMTAMPQDLLQEISNESLYPIAGFSNAYTKFREIINKSRLTIHESGNVDTWLGGLLANPFDLIPMTNSLEAKEMLNVAQEMEAAANEIDQGNQRLQNVKFNWSYSANSMQPLFNTTMLQQNYSQGIKKQQQAEIAEQEKQQAEADRERRIQDANIQTPRTPGAPTVTAGPGWNPRVPDTGSRPGRPGIDTSSLDRPSIPKIDTTPSINNPGIKPNSNITDSLPKIDTKTETSNFNPDSLTKPDTTITTPKVPKLDSESIKTDASRAETQLNSPVAKSPNGITTPETKVSKSPDLPNIDQTPKTSSGITTPPSPKTDPKNPSSPLNSQNLTTGVRGQQPMTLPAASTTPKQSTGIKTPAAPTPAPVGGGGGLRGGIPTSPVTPPSAPAPTNPANTVQAGINNPENKNTPPPIDPAAETPEAPEFEDNAISGERETTTISRDGKTFEMGSGKAAKLAELINPTDGSAPMSLRDAMAEAGYEVPDPGANPGKPISPMDLQPGDLVIGEKYQGIFVGDGMVLTSEGLKPLGEVAVFSGEPNQGFFRPDVAEVDADASRTGQEASATEDFEAGDETKSSGRAGETTSGPVSPGLGGLGHNGTRAAVGNANAGRKASVTPGGDPFDPSGSKVASDPFERIAVTGTGGIGRSFSPNVPTGD